MGLTRPKIWDIDTNIEFFNDPITVLHQGATTANVDVGFLFNRANGLVSNVAVYWSESLQSFVTTYTTSTGVINSNIVVTSYANLTIGSLFSINGNIYLNGSQGTPGQYITATSSGTAWTSSSFTGGVISSTTYPSGNLTLNLGTTTAYWANVYTGNLIVGQNILWGNGTVFSTGSGGTTFTGGYVPNQSTFGANLVANSGVASTSTTTGALVVAGGAGIAGNINTGAIYTNSYNFANGSAFVSTTLANTADITANIPSGSNAGLSLTATGVVAGNYGSATSIPTIVVDNKGRITSLTSNAVSTTINLSGTSGTGSVAGGGTLTFDPANGITATISGSTVTIADTLWQQANANLGTATTNISSLQANIGAFEIYANANIGSIYTNLNTLNANLGAYQSFANIDLTYFFNTTNATNANLGAYQIYANTQISTTQANLGAYQTFANANAASQQTQINNIVTTANANLAANLQNFVTNIVSTANITANYFVGNNVTINGANNTALTIAEGGTGIASWTLKRYTPGSPAFSAVESNGTGLFFKSDGTVMYYSGQTSDRVNEFALSTSWDITTATNVATSGTSIASQDGNSRAIYFKPDGTKMYMHGSATQRVYEYTLGTAWWSNTASNVGAFVGNAWYGTTPNGLQFNSTGSRMYVANSTGNIQVFSLSTPWSVNSASYTSNFYANNSLEGAYQGFSFNSSGNSLVLAGSSTGKSLVQFNLATPYDLTTAVYVGRQYYRDPIGGDNTSTGMFGIYYADSVNSVFVQDQASDVVSQWSTNTLGVIVTSISTQLFDGNVVNLANVVVVQPGYVNIFGNIISSGVTQNHYIGGTINYTTLQGTFLNSTGNSQINTSTGTTTSGFSSGAITSGSIKTVNIGVAGLAGSNSNIIIGPTLGVGNVFFQLGTPVTISNATSSIASNSGALVVAGGAGIAGNLYVGGIYIGAGGTNGLFWSANNAAVSTGGGSSPAGSTGQVQYNNGGALGASTLYYWSGNSTITTTSAITAGSIQGTPIGSTTASSGAFTSLSASSFKTTQTTVTLGASAGLVSQGTYAIAIGTYAGYNTQGAYSVVVGPQAGQNTVGQYSVLAGYNAGFNSTSANVVSIGPYAGYQSAATNSVAIGNQAGYYQSASGIVINATGNQLNGNVAGFVVAPVRNDNGNISLQVAYNTTTNEFTYSNTISVANATIVAGLVTNLTITGNLTVSGNITSATFPLILNDISSQFNANCTVFALKNNQTAITNLVDSKDLSVVVDGRTLSPYVTELRYPWITPYNGYKGFRVATRSGNAKVTTTNISQYVVIYNAPDSGQQATVTQINTSATKQTRRYPYSASSIALGD